MTTRTEAVFTFNSEQLDALTLALDILRITPMAVLTREFPEWDDLEASVRTAKELADAIGVEHFKLLQMPLEDDGTDGGYDRSAGACWREDFHSDC